MKCEYCGNTSEVKDERGGCVSCGAFEFELETPFFDFIPSCALSELDSSLHIEASDIPPKPINLRPLLGKALFALSEINTF